MFRVKSFCGVQGFVIESIWEDFLLLPAKKLTAQHVGSVKGFRVKGFRRCRVQGLGAVKGLILPQ